MMRRLFATVVVLVSFALLAPLAQAAEDFKETVEADVTTRSVSITSGFTGSQITVFGTVENSNQPSAEAGTYDVVVVVEGMPLPVIVRKKSRVGGLWVNTRSLRFASFPSYYAIASTRPLEEITHTKALNDNEIGFNHVRLIPAGAIASDFDPELEAEFRAAVIHLKQQEKLYVTSDHGVSFIGRSLFRATVSLPPNIAVGPLVARVYLFKDSKLLSYYTNTVSIARGGIEQFLYDSAFERPVFYAISTILFALLSGLAGAYVVNRIFAR